MIKPYTTFLSQLPILFCFMFCAATNAQKVFRLDSLKNGVVLNKGWKFHNGDNKEWANSAFDDRDWDSIAVDTLGVPLEKNKFNGIGWVRLHLKVSPALFHKTVFLIVHQLGASEIYFNSSLIESFGKVGSLQEEVPFDPGFNVFPIILGGDTMQEMSVRYSQNKVLSHEDINLDVFSIQLYNPSMVNALVSTYLPYVEYSLWISAVFITLSIFHLLLFVYYRKTRSNLYYSIFALMIAFCMITFFVLSVSHNPVFMSYTSDIGFALIPMCFFFIIVLLYSIFERKFNWFFWTLIGLSVITDGFFFAGKTSIYFLFLINQMCSASIGGIVMIIKALRKRKPGAWIIASGFLLFLCLIPGMLLLGIVDRIIGHSQNLGLNITMFIFWIFSIPASMSAYLASDFAKTNKKLSLQLVHVKQLSEQNIEKEIEKKQIIEGQKEMLEIQVREKTSEIQEQKNELLQKNTEIIDSILYARRIQTAILPTEEMLKAALGDYLVIFKPKDVVSGDFYWCHVNGDTTVFAVADCTGHGVPGALMSMICNSLLNEVVTDGKAYEADLILNELRSKLITTLQQSGGVQTTRDGMDIALCVWNKRDNILQYAGANNPLYLIREKISPGATIGEPGKIKVHDDHLLEIVGDKQPIGFQEGKMDIPFTKHIIQLGKGDIIYITSDGYIDQFGGFNNKKFTSKRLRNLLVTFINQSIDAQRMTLVQTIEDWKKDEVQTDDICIFGIKI